MSRTPTLLRSFFVAAALALGPGCGGGDTSPDNGTDGASDADTAADLSDDADQGTDADTTGRDDADALDDGAAAPCAPGYQDHDGDGVCLPDCATAGLVCSGRSHCDDASGTVACVCDAGTQDHDGNGSCLPDCTTAGLACGDGAACDDASGTAVCLCLAGYQDHDGNGVCLPDCTTAAPDCNGHGTCDDASGTALCACADEYTGDSCDACAWGYQDHDGDGVCTAGCSLAAADCPLHSTCDDASGTATCICDDGYLGAACDSCALGYQDHDLNGSCWRDCASAALVCPAHAACDDSRGPARCTCDEGYQDHDGDGTCLADCSTAGLACDASRHCDDLSGTATCACARGYAGADCSTCAAGFVDSFGACIPDHAWTFIVYLDADNALDSSGADDLAEMTDAGSSDQLHIVVLFDSFSGGGHALYVRTGATDVVRDWGEPDMGDYRTLRDFGSWAVRAYPAQHYALILWDDGDAWTKSATSSSPLGFAGDAHGSGEEMSIAGGDLALALQGIAAALDGRRLDLLGFDACRMGSWEVAEAVAPYARNLVASSENEPASGWSYREVLRGLRGDPATTAAALGTAIVDAYHDASTLDFTLALVDLDAVSGIETAVDGLAGALLAQPGLWDDVDAARHAAQGFADADLRDLSDLAARIAALAGAPAEVSAAAGLVVSAVGAAVVHGAVRSGYAQAHGLSVYMPARDAGMDCRYVAGAGATWSARTRWGELLAAFTAASCPAGGP